MILITGATGNVGGATATALANAGVPFRVAVRSPDKLRDEIERVAEIAQLDLSDPSGLDVALRGVDRLLLVTPNSEQQEFMEKHLVEAAAHAGVEYVLKVSSIEAGEHARAPIAQAHYRTEQLISDLIPASGFLRPVFFMQTLFIYADPVRNAGILPMPLGDARVSMIDVRDLGKAAAKLLTESTPRTGPIPISGTAPQSIAEVAQQFSDVLDKPVRYVDIAPEQFREQLEANLPSPWHVDAICRLFDEIREGVLDQDFPAVAELTGEPAITLCNFLQDHEHVFREHSA